MSVAENRPEPPSSAADLPGLRFEGLSLAFGARTIFSGLDLTVPGGTFVVLLGVSGVGKSSLLRIAAGLATPTAGRVAPLLVLWFGFGISSKVVMAVLVIFFPVTASLSDGLRHTELGWIELARTMGASPLRVLWHVRLPAALPAFGSGLRVATAIAPIGAVIGEWVGASNGLGYVMLNANARVRTDLMFAALFVLALMTILLWTGIDRQLRRVLYWAPDTMACV